MSAGYPRRWLILDTVAVVVFALASAAYFWFAPASAEEPRTDPLFLRPQYAQAAVWHHVRLDLLKLDDAAERRRRFEGFVRIYGEAYGPGVRAELAAMGDREPYATLLTQLGGPPENEPVEMHALGDRVDKLELNDAVELGLVRTLKGLLADDLNPYDAVDRQIAEAHDYLAIACMKRLLERGDAHHELIEAYIVKRIGTAEHHGNELRAIRKRIADEDDGSE